MPEENRVYLWLSINMDDFNVVYMVAKRVNQTPQQFIMEALKTHLLKLQQEARVKEEAPPAPTPTTEKKEEKGDKQ